MDFIRSSSPSPREARRLWYSSRSAALMPQEKPRRLPRRLAMARFSSMPISAAVPIMGSWNTRPRKVARRCSGSFSMATPSRRMEPLSAW